MNGRQAGREELLIKMRLKKINAILGLLLMAICLTHIVLEIIDGLSGWEKQTYVAMTARICGTIAIFHVLISIGMIFFVHDKKGLGAYPGKNMGTLIQRISGLMMIILLAIHVRLSQIISAHQEEETGFFILCITVMILFYLTVFVHIALSFTRALITLGAITSRKKKDQLDVVLRVITGLGFLASSILMTCAYSQLPGTGGGA